jgi:hypothetical protein
VGKVWAVGGVVWRICERCLAQVYMDSKMKDFQACLNEVRASCVT